jgi:hypothetical protein
VRTILSPSEVWGLAQDRRRSTVARKRMALYGEASNYYWGTQPKGGDGTTWATNSLGLALVRHTGSAMDLPRTISSNRIAPIVNDHYALLGRLPAVRTDIPSGGVEKAEHQDKYLYSTYELSSMEYQQAQVGFFLSNYGDACYALEVDWDRDRRVVISSVDPQYCYPSWYRGYRKFELYDMIIAYYESDDVLERDFDYKPKSSTRESCLVVTYISPFQRTVVIGEDLYQPYDTVEWNLGFCPAVWMQSYITDGSLANSDVRELQQLQDLYDFNLNMQVDGAVGWVFGLTGIKDPLERDAPLETGPGATIALGDKGDIINRPGGGDPSFLRSFQSELVDQMNTSAGTSSVRQQGMPDKSNISGHALRAAQGPESTRLDMRQVIMGRSFQILNSYLFKMQEVAPLLGDKEFEIDGRYKGRSFTTKFLPKRDIDGWYRTSVTWDALLGMSKAQRIAAAGQAKALRLMPDRKLREWIGEDDPEQAKEEIYRDMVEEAVAQARAQMEAQKVMQGGDEGAHPPPPGGPAEQAPSSSGQGPQIPTSRPVRPPYLGQGGANPTPGASPTGAPPGVNPMGVTIAQIKAALQQVSLKGSVFVLGELAVTGRTLAPKLAISDYRDHGKVVTAMRPLAPNVKVEAMSEADLPDESERVA